MNTYAAASIYNLFMQWQKQQNGCTAYIIVLPPIAGTKTFPAMEVPLLAWLLLPVLSLCFCYAFHNTVSASQCSCSTIKENHHQLINVHLKGNSNYFNSMNFNTFSIQILLGDLVMCAKGHKLPHNWELWFHHKPILNIRDRPFWCRHRSSTVSTGILLSCLLTYFHESLMFKISVDANLCTTIWLFFLPKNQKVIWCNAWKSFS